MLGVIPESKNQPARRIAGAQADSRIGESAFLDCFGGAVVSAGAAIDTQISVDDIDAVAFGNSLNGAVVYTGAAANASVSNFVSHDVTSNK